MRTAKFRGKTPEGKWVYGSLILGAKIAYIGKANDNEDSSIQIYYDPVNPETVGQSTGLQDKNSKEIYADDILQDFMIYGNAFYGNKYRVFTVAGGFAINKFQDELDKLSTVREPLAGQGGEYISKNCEVIGNIHDNRNLLDKI